MDNGSFVPVTVTAFPQTVQKSRKSGQRLVALYFEKKSVAADNQPSTHWKMHYNRYHMTNISLNQTLGLRGLQYFQSFATPKFSIETNEHNKWVSYPRYNSFITKNIKEITKLKVSKCVFLLNEQAGRWALQPSHIRRCSSVVKSQTAGRSCCLDPGCLYLSLLAISFNRHFRSLNFKEKKKNAWNRNSRMSLKDTITG